MKLSQIPIPKLSNKSLFLLIITALLTIGFSIERYFKEPDSNISTLYIQSGTRMWSFEVESARTKKEREKGLMFRRRLADDTGMLFEFPKPQVTTMWMKNTLIPLDMLFIDAKGFIVFIKERARPRSMRMIRYDRPVTGVLELPAGTVRKRMLQVGDFVIHPFFDHTGHRK